MPTDETARTRAVVAAARIYIHQLHYFKQSLAFALSCFSCVCALPFCVALNERWIGIWSRPNFRHGPPTSTLPPHHHHHHTHTFTYIHAHIHCAHAARPPPTPPTHPPSSSVSRHVARRHVVGQEQLSVRVEAADVVRFELGRGQLRPPQNLNLKPKPKN